MKKLEEKQGVLNVAFNEDPEILSLYQKVKLECIKAHNDGLKEYEFKVPFKYKDTVFNLTISYKPKLQFQEGDNLGQAYVEKSEITLFINVKDHNFSHVFFHELQHCLWTVNKQELTYNRVDNIIYRSESDFEHYKKLYTNNKFYLKLEQVYNEYWKHNQKIARNLKMVFYKFNPVEVLAWKENVIDEVFELYNLYNDINYIKNNILNNFLWSQETIKNIIYNPSRVIILCILNAIWFENDCYCQYKTTNFFPKSFITNPKLKKLYDNIELSDKEKDNFVFNILIKATDRVCTNEKTNNMLRDYVYKRAMYLREKASKLYTKVIENTWYMLKENGIADLKNKQYLILKNEEKQCYSFESYLNDKGIFVNCPNFKAFSDIITLYKVLKQETSYLKDYKFITPIQLNKAPKLWRSIDTFYDECEVFFISLLYIAEVRLNIQTEQKFFENFYYIINEIKVDDYIEGFKEMCNQKNMDVNSPDIDLREVKKDFYKVIEIIKKDFPSIKFKYV